MAGNVEEYTSDDYAIYPGGKFIADDLQVSLGTYKVARGGSFSRYRDLTRNTRRHGAYKKISMLWDLDLLKITNL